jgi:hypothetical protein
MSLRGSAANSLLLSGPGTIACTALSRLVGLELFLRGWTWRPKTASAAANGRTTDIHGGNVRRVVSQKGPPPLALVVLGT